MLLCRQLGDEVFHPSSLVNFRNRLEEHGQSALGFKTILAGLEQAGLVSRQSRQRLDSTQMFGRVSKMNRLDCVRESLRLALEEVAKGLDPAGRPAWWAGLWERYVESRADYRASGETLGRKLVEAGSDAQRLLEWLGQQPDSLAQGEQARLLARVFGEQFEVSVGSAAPQPTRREPMPSKVKARKSKSRWPAKCRLPRRGAGRCRHRASPRAMPSRASWRSLLLKATRRGLFRWKPSKRRWGWKSRPCSTWMALISRPKSWCKCKPKAGNSLARLSRRRRKTAGSPWKIFKSMWRSAPPCH